MYPMTVMICMQINPVFEIPSLFPTHSPHSTAVETVSEPLRSATAVCNDSGDFLFSRRTVILRPQYPGKASSVPTAWSMVHFRSNNAKHALFVLFITFQWEH